MKKFIKNKTILVTGGTGFLGKALVKELLKFEPKSIRIFSRDEVKHDRMNQEFKFDFVGGPLRHLVGDVRDYKRIKKAMLGCDIVIHAAALKRIDMIEYNVEESIKTNILGTLNVIRAALENNVEKVVFISSDKACSPANSYGACKFVSEKIMTESNFNKGSARTIFNSVRYGNVISSTGSIIPLFIEKIKKGEDIPLTHPEMTRFLITSKQAVYLIFNAIKYGVGGEIFVPKAPSFKIVDLIGYLKKKYSSNNKIKIIGLRPGEKMHELMINDVEAPRTYEFEGCLVVLSQIERYQKRIKQGFLKKTAKKIDFKGYNSKDTLLEGERLEEYLNKISFI